MQHAVNTPIEEAVFSMLFACIHCGAMDIFFMDPPPHYISGAEPNQIRMTQNENGASPQQSRKKGSAENSLYVLVIDCDYE
jgi:hypothetical protein